ncbi:MAG TPA: lysophospholipid acyltransferase family protein [Polyangiaceae bacterium]|nr:lysophospholipid acyltransferase family protein [Polyangiaceae bacterium]
MRWSPPVIGLLFAALLPSARRLVARNLRLIFGRRDAWVELRDVARTFVQFASCLAESLGADRSEAMTRAIRVRGGSRVEEMLARNQGFVIATAHVGPWDGTAQALAQLGGARVMIVMAHEHDAEAEQLHDQVRAKAQLKVLRIGRHPLDALPALEHLASGGVVAVQVDRVPRGNAAVAVKLFGEDFAVPQGPFQLAGLAKVPLLPIFSARTGYFTRRIDIGFPVWPSRRPRGEELRELAQCVVSQMEGQIAAFPLQWFHFITDEEQRQAREQALARG